MIVSQRRCLVKERWKTRKKRKRSRKRATWWSAAAVLGVKEESSSSSSSSSSSLCVLTSHPRRAGMLSGGVKDNVFLKYRYGYGQLHLKTTPQETKNKTRKMSKNSQNIPVYTAAQVLQRISLSLYREREKKEAEVHALGSSYVISFSLVSPLLFLPFQSFLSFLSATILLLV